MKRALALIFTIAAYAARLLFRGMKRALALIVIIAAYVAGFFSIRGVKRALTLIVIIAACVVGLLSVRGTMPFMPVFGTSMEPELQAGNLILIEEVSPSEIEVGDIVAFTIPPLVREHYNYPPVIAHRVVEVYTKEYGTIFRTKGDNAGEDPFTVRPEDLLGRVSKQIPYLGFPLLFFQSKQGLIFIISVISLLALYLYADELGRGRRWAQRGIFAPVIEESRRSSRVLERRIKTTENGMAGTQQALNNFASAIADYAGHLKSHTSAIQGLSEASQELKKGAIEQNKVLTRLVETMEEISPKPKIEEIKPRVAVRFPPGCVRSRRQVTEDEKLFRAG